MKTLFVFLFSISLFNLSNLDTISEALRVGDVNTLAAYFDDQVEISVLEKEDIYDKAAAKKILATFFATNKPVSFEQVHKGKSKNNTSIYCIGNLSTDTQSYRVYVYLNIVGEKQLIQELRIDEE